MIAISQTSQGCVSLDTHHEQAWGQICEGHNLALLSGVGSSFTFPLTIEGKIQDAEMKVTVEWVSSTPS